MFVLDVVPVQSESVKAALRHPWIHSPHSPVDGDLLWSCSTCGKKLQSLNGCFPIYRGRNPCATSDPPLVLEERAIVRDLGLLLPRNFGSAKFRAAPALLAGTKEIEVCRRRTKAFDWSCPDCVPAESPRVWLLAKQHAWAHGKVLQTEKTLVPDDFRKQRCEAAVENSRELLMALWNEHRPERAHQLTGATKGEKIASAHAPTRLQRCAVCDKWLHSALLDGCGILVPE